MTPAARRASSGSSPLTRGKHGQRRKGLPRGRLIPAHAGKTRRDTCAHGELWAHPRSRGENEIGCGVAFAACGSSPLTRGKPWSDLTVRVRPRLIPAHAGKTASHTGSYTPCPGSSPLTRGKPEVGGRTVRDARLIPAHAGKTRGDRRYGKNHRAHPRSRGENEALGAALGELAGSSPLTRGKHSCSRSDRAQRGLIPAHAGKTYGFRAASVWPRAHPRSRGENGLRLSRLSPPPWLIPAHAGKTPIPAVDTRTTEAHPRSRGENRRRLSHVATARGSSPLTRGKPTGARRTPGRSRLIPAHAGKTPCRVQRAWWSRAHPRSRGENLRGHGGRLPGAGSSPLTRGKLGQAVLGHVSERLIPAHAGKTFPCCRLRRRSGAHPRSRGENSIREGGRRGRRGSSPLTRGKPAPDESWKLAVKAHPRSRGENKSV